MTPTTSKLSNAEQSQARTLTLGPHWLVHKTVGFLTSFTNGQLNQLADYKLLLELLPSGSLEVVRTKKALQTLEPRVQAAQKRETTEMIDKLKGLGNSILGLFYFQHRRRHAKIIL